MTDQRIGTLKDSKLLVRLPGDAGGHKCAHDLPPLVGGPKLVPGKDSPCTHNWLDLFTEALHRLGMVPTS